MTALGDTPPEKRLFRAAGLERFPRRLAAFCLGLFRQVSVKNLDRSPATLCGSFLALPKNPGGIIRPTFSGSALAEKPIAVSALLHHLREEFGPEKHGPLQDVTVGEILHLFGVRGFAFLILALAMLNMVIFMVPGLSLLFGLPMVFLTLQMVAGRQAPLLPHFLMSRTIKRSFLILGLEKGSATLAQIEPYLRPRFSWLTGPRMDRVHSVVALVLSCLVALPVPFLNLPPSFAVVVLGLGILQRDGLFILLAYGLAVWSFWLFGSFGQIVQNLFA